jgi:soluble cytochrome b562
MPTLECSAVRESGVTLVEARLESDARRRVSVEATHDSAVWPPRREGVPAAGWSEDGWSGVVPADGTVALGYATPGPVDGQPLRLAEAGPADEDTTATARDVIRSLGDARPPRDAVAEPTPETPTKEPATAPAVDGLDAIASRIDRAEALAAADSVEAARTAVAEAGGIGAVRDLATQLERDRERLSALGRRVDELRGRAAVEVPVDDLTRIA